MKDTLSIKNDIKNGTKFKNIIYTEVNQGLNFDLTYERKLEIIELGYETTNNHIKNNLNTI